MAIHIANKDAERLLREFASERKMGLARALRTAVLEANRARKPDDTNGEESGLRDELDKLRGEVKAVYGDMKRLVANHRISR